MNKRTATLRAVVPEWMHEYANEEARRQRRTVSTYLMLLIERDMRTNDAVRVDSRTEPRVSTVDMMSALSNDRPKFGPRRAA